MLGGNILDREAVYLLIISSYVGLRKETRGKHEPQESTSNIFSTGFEVVVCSDSIALDPVARWYNVTSHRE